MHKRLNKLLVANRGESAVRIVRAAQALGIPTVAVCSEADRDSRAARLADEVRLIGPARADQSYLDSEAILAAARETGADSIHPGYGFLSENPAFSEAVQAAGLVFVGPDAQTIRRMGDKAEARRTAMAAGVPVVPGSPGELDDLDVALACAEEVGYPLLVKASAGGGGRGLRIARAAAALRREFPLAPRAAPAAVG
ncbi:acetyl-CoA carboxylase biotin carboxylase subunit, partial [Pseudomonas aeruginosa]|nr:acetyl-CoA carboxylase biotin carboxylase subunit [Pseudomonas aeruginosa]